MSTIHPGRILLQRHMLAFGLSQNALARAMAVPPRRINEIIHGKRAISADTAVRLGRFFGNDPAYWMRLQAEFDIAQAQNRIGRQLETLPVLAGLTPLTGRPPPRETGDAPRADRRSGSRNIKRRMMR
jgi:addiction module HigA family antidote